MSPAEITSAVLEMGVPPWVPPFFYDISYAKPSKSWLLNTFGSWFFSRRGKYSRKNDCDNFARAFCVFCQDAHAETSQPDEAAAVGEFCYIRDDGTGAHALNLAFTDSGPTFIEPQTCKEVTLTKHEISTCFRISF